jgi:hypothetical protein
MIMKILRGTLFGGIAFFFLGWLVWGILLADVMANLMDTTLNRPDDGMVWWAIILSNLVFALLLTLSLKWTGAKGITDGLKTGALIGVLYSLTADLGMYSMTTMIKSASAIVIDVLVYAVVAAIMGLVIVLTWGKEKAA